MDMEEKPVPTEARQSTLGPSAGHAALTFSKETPLRPCPRHSGQSAAGTFEARSATVTIQESFMGYLYHKLRGVTRLYLPLD
jgi:hypothetical protein